MPWAEGAFWIPPPPPRQGDARGGADARSSAEVCLSWQKVQGREANRRRHRLTEPTTKALCQTPPPPLPPVLCSGQTRPAEVRRDPPRGCGRRPRGQGNQVLRAAGPFATGRRPVPVRGEGQGPCGGLGGCGAPRVCRGPSEGGLWVYFGAQGGHDDGNVPRSTSPPPPAVPALFSPAVGAQLQPLTPPPPPGPTHLNRAKLFRSKHQRLKHAAARRSLPQHAAACHSMPQPATACRSMPQPATACHSMLQHAAACHSMPQHATACHSMPQHTENWVGNFFWGTIGPKYQFHPCAVICQRWTVLQWSNGASAIERTLFYFLAVAICNNAGRGRST